MHRMIAFKFLSNVNKEFVFLPLWVVDVDDILNCNNAYLNGFIVVEVL